MRAWLLLSLLAIHSGCATAPEKTCVDFPERKMCWDSYQEAMAALTQMQKEAEENNARKEAAWLAKQPPEVREAWMKAKEREAQEAESVAAEQGKQIGADQTEALGALMGSANRIAHSSDAASDQMLNSSRRFNQALNRMESERRGIDSSPRFEQGGSFNRSTLPYGIQGAEVPIEELDQYVPQR